MGKVHISQFYPCSVVSTASELCYICELGKYLFVNHDTMLSIDGVVLDSVLKKSKIWDYFRIFVRSGYICDVGISTIEIEITVQNSIDWENLKLRNVIFTTDKVSYNSADARQRSENFEYDIVTPKEFQIEFTEQTDEVWLMNMSSKSSSANNINNYALNGFCGRVTWVSLLAYVAVERLMTGRPERFLISFNASACANYKALAYVLSLADKTNCLYGWCFYTFDQSVTTAEALHQGYVSWYVEGTDLGLLNRFFPPKEKLEYIKQLDIQVGDVVMLYQRNKTQSRDYLKSIANCHVAVVKEISEHGVRFQIINTSKLRFHGLYDFNDQTTIVKSMYTTSRPYENLNCTYRTIDMIDLGIEYKMREELYFIVPLSSCDDVKVSIVSDGNNVDKLCLPQNDFIYWLFKDYEVEFNEARFLDKYFPSMQPLYTMYMETGAVPKEFYFTDND